MQKVLVFFFFLLAVEQISGYSAEIWAIVEDEPCHSASGAAAGTGEVFRRQISVIIVVTSAH